jgi:hypothetical protein
MAKYPKSGRFWPISDSVGEVSWWT